MTDINIPELRRLAEAGTPGPFHILADDEFPDRLHQIWTLRPTGAPDALIARTCFAPSSADNAAKIVAAVNNLTPLLDRLEYLEGLTKRLRPKLEPDGLSIRPIPDGGAEITIDFATYAEADSVSQWLAGLIDLDASEKTDA